MKSTTSALLPLTQKVVAGFNQNNSPLWTVTMAIDLSKAFDTVNLTKLIEASSDTSLYYNIIRWQSAYLRGKIASCRYKDATSTCHALRASDPQGSMISPLLFRFFVSNYL